MEERRLKAIATGRGLSREALSLVHNALIRGTKIVLFFCPGAQNLLAITAF